MPARAGVGWMRNASDDGLPGAPEIPNQHAKHQCILNLDASLNINTMSNSRVRLIKQAHG
jgi:hypothetical protein